MIIERTIAYTEKPYGGFKEIEFKEVDLSLLQSIFNPPADDPYMYLPYQISEIHAEALEKIFDIKFDFNKYLYDLHTYSSNFSYSEFWEKG